jgi:hypothetical protein
VSTDASVADPREVEIELGYFNLDRAHRENTISTPHVVLNYGVAKNLELVAEFNLQVNPDVELTDPWRPARCFRRRYLTKIASDSRRSPS